jgi:hypothetical protein
MTNKLFYLQLMKEGFPISWWTFAQIAKIPNFGPPPEGTNTELERWQAQQRIQIELKAELQKEAMISQAETQAELAARGLMVAGPEAGGPPGAGGGGDEGGNGGPRGRPQSYATPPRMVSKDGGSRTTITTAKR